MKNIAIKLLFSIILTNFGLISAQWLQDVELAIEKHRSQLDALTSRLMMPSKASRSYFAKEWSNVQDSIGIAQESKVDVFVEDQNYFALNNFGTATAITVPNKGVFFNWDDYRLSPIGWKRHAMFHEAQHVKNDYYYDINRDIKSCEKRADIDAMKSLQCRTCVNQVANIVRRADVDYSSHGYLSYAEAIKIRDKVSWEKRCKYHFLPALRWLPIVPITIKNSRLIQYDMIPYSAFRFFEKNTYYNRYNFQMRCFISQTKKHSSETQADIKALFANILLPKDI